MSAATIVAGRREPHRAPDDQRLQHVVLELLVHEEDREAITPTTAPCVSREQRRTTAPPRKPPICGIGFVIATHTAISGASGTPSASAPVEHDDAGERGDEQRARDVAADDVVHEAADAVGVGRAGVRERAGARRRRGARRRARS